MTYWLQMRVPRSQNQSADSTAWTGFSIIIHDTVWMQISCPYQHFITYTNVKIHSFNVPLQGFLCQFQFLEFTSLRYENRKRFNIYRYSPSALSVLWYYPGIRRSDETQVNNGERPGISTARLFLLHDQIMNFDWMWTVTWLFKWETVCDHKMYHVIPWDALYSVFTFWCSFILGAEILLKCYLYLNILND